MRRTKILCTIGPQNASPKILEGLLKSGMNMVRLNMSHGTQQWHAKTIKLLRSLEERCQTPLPILLDLQGPRIRVGSLPKHGIQLHEGGTVSLVPNDQANSDNQKTVTTIWPTIPIGYSTLSKDMKPGHRVLINDGLIELVVKQVTKKRLVCSVIVGGKVTSHKGINFPDTSLSAPSLTDKDHDDIRFAVENNVDYVALSFVRSEKDIQMTKAYLKRSGLAIPVIAKIERPEAVQRLTKILDRADGVMVARGDLAIEMTIEAVPVLQKQIIAEANRCDRLVITATQMLESMTQHSMPTRAEASDVANAVLDGSDMLMLSAETSTGAYPLQAVQVMDRVIRTAEASDVLRWEPAKTHQGNDVSASACVATASAARLTQAKLILVLTNSGTTAFLMSKQRPDAPIIGMTPYSGSLRRMKIFWGVDPYLMPNISNTDERIQVAETILKRQQLAKRGDRIVILSGEHGQKLTGANIMKIHKIR